MKMKKICLLLVMVAMLVSVSFADEVDLKRDSRNVQALAYMVNKTPDVVHEFFDSPPDSVDEKANVELYAVSFHGKDYTVCVYYENNIAVHVSLSCRFSKEMYEAKSVEEYNYLKDLATSVYGIPKLASPLTLWLPKTPSYLIVLERSKNFDEDENLLGVDAFNTEWFRNSYIK